MHLAQLNVARLRAPMDDPIILRRRREFFEVPTQPILCVWWIPEGTIPTVDDALARLEHLRANGPTPTAFTFRQRFEPGDDHAHPGDARDVCLA